MSNAEGFRGHGFKCLSQAREATTLPDRLRWLDMAQYWFARAEADEKASAADAGRRDDDRIKSFHHV
jgi:hypothetical protein